LNKDIRLKVTFPNHKKTIKLIHLIGCDGFYSLVQLWCYVAQNHPKGILNDYDKYDLEIAARWTGERGEFTKAVTRKDINFVKKIVKGYEIKDWEEHNPYVFHADERSEKARQAAKARWKTTDSKGLDDASSIDVALPQASVSNAPSPSPSPPPIPKPKKTLAGFEDLWKRYPNKDGKKAAEKYFNSTVKTKEDYAAINKALDKYITNLKTETWKKPKNGSTWFNNWQDWVNWEETGTMEPLYTMPDINGGTKDLYSDEEMLEHKALLAKTANERKGPDGR
jgi:hypothetical protein